MKTTALKFASTRILAALAVVALPLLASSNPVYQADGADTAFEKTKRLSDTFSAKQSSFQLRLTRLGTDFGFSAMPQGRIDLCTSMRAMTAEEIAECVAVFGRRPTEYKVCLDAIGIYVHADNPVKELTADQVAQIFRGEVRNWKQVGGSDAPIVLFGHKLESGTREFFQHHVLDDEPLSMRVKARESDQSILQSVAGERNAIGYGRVASAGDVKQLAIKSGERGPAVPMNKITVADGTYPLRGYVAAYANPNTDKGKLAAYLKWIQGEEGQRIAEESGFHPLPNYLRTQ